MVTTLHSEMGGWKLGISERRGFFLPFTSVLVLSQSDGLRPEAAAIKGVSKSATVSL